MENIVVGIVVLGFALVLRWVHQRDVERIARAERIRARIVGRPRF